jgi:hypothetical protein
LIDVSGGLVNSDVNIVEKIFEALLLFLSAQITKNRTLGSLSDFFTKLIRWGPHISHIPLGGRCAICQDWAFDLA